MMDEPTLFGLLEQARSFVSDGKSLHAIQIYKRIIDSSPDLAEPWVELFKIYCHLQRFDTAEHLLLESLQYVAEKKEIVFLLGVLHLQTNNNHGALTYFRQLQQQESVLDSEFQSRVHFNLGLVYVQMHRWGLAEHHLRKTRQLNPEFPKIDEALSEILMRRGHVREVIEILQASLSKDPYSWLGHYVLGIAFTRTRQWKSAYEEFVVAVEMDPNEPRSWQKCGECLIALHELDQAEHYLRKALELNPKFTDAVVNYGFLYLERGDRVRASELFDNVLAVEPAHNGAKEGKRIILKTKQTPTP
ncbi:MAG TPA: tetratricopeptide repeat protein [Bacteroidota bacterium]